MTLTKPRSATLSHRPIRARETRHEKGLLDGAFAKVSTRARETRCGPRVSRLGPFPNNGKGNDPKDALRSKHWRVSLCSLRARVENQHEKRILFLLALIGKADPPPPDFQPTRYAQAEQWKTF